MRAPHPIRIRDQQLWLSAERTVFWEDQKILIVSDLHFGKTGHFRKSGIPVSQSIYQEDLYRLQQQTQYFQPRQVIITGDLFHSRDNLEIDWFGQWREFLKADTIHLVPGNHDRLPPSRYQSLGLAYHDGCLQIDPFLFVHDSRDQSPDDAGLYCFSGHLHPGIRINGPGKQSMRFPCFHFSKQMALLPAFSHFTGMKIISPDPEDQVFAILPASTRHGESAVIFPCFSGS